MQGPIGTYCLFFFFAKHKYRIGLYFSNEKTFTNESRVKLGYNDHGYNEFTAIMN
jgi:hypothetical protein